MKQCEKDLASKAEHELSMCCQTICNSSVVKEYISDLENEILDLQKYIAELEEAVQ